MASTEPSEFPAATTAALLSALAGGAAQPALAELMRRHAGLVHGAAARVLGRADLAADVAQEVFSRLPRAAGGIRPPALAAWLHRSALRAALNVRRAERRRIQRESAAAEAMNAPAEAPHPALEHLDAALDQLGETERSLVVERFHDGASFDTIARNHGKSPDAARMTVNRALEKMREFLRGRGVATTAATLVSLLGVELTRAMPPGLRLAPKIPAAAALNPSILTILIMTKPVWLTLAALLIFCLCWGGGYLANRPKNQPKIVFPVSKAAPEAPLVKTTTPPASVPAPGGKSSAAAELVARLVAMEKELADFPQADPDRLEAKILAVRAEEWAAVRALDTETAAEALELAAGQPTRFAWNFLLAGLLRTDPERAKNHAERMTPILPAGAKDKGSPLGHAYGLNDPAAALKAAERWYAEDAGKRASFLRGVWTGWMESDAAAAIAALEQAPLDDQGHLADMFASFKELSSQREAGATAISALGDEALRIRVVEAVTGEWSKANPRAAAAWFALIRWREPATAFGIAQNLSNQWIEQAKQSPVEMEAMLLWMVPYVPEERREKMRLRVTKRFGQEFPEAVAAFLKKL